MRWLKLVWKMGEPDILALSENCRLAEWSTRLKGYPPNTRPPQGAIGHRVDYYVELLESRWIYPLIHRTAVGGGFQIPFEAYADEEGRVWFAEGSKPPSEPIPKRGDPREGVSDTHVHFPMTDSEGYALSIRLLYSPFRLSSLAIKMLNSSEFQKSIIKRMTPLWTWTEREDENSPVHSRDGYSVKVDPLWCTPRGKLMPAQIWVGSDPFAIAENRSNLYVRKRREYAEIFEPTDEKKRRELERIMLGQALNDAIAVPPEAKNRYGKYLDIGRMNEEIGAFEKKQSEMRKDFEKSAFLLAEHLRSPVFALLQYASMDDEGFEEAAEYHAAAVEHLRVLDRVLRALDKCKAGLELLAEWAQESEKNPHHFINRVVLPQSVMPVHLFRTARWSSKSLINILRKFGPGLAATKSDFLQRVVASLVHLGIADAQEVKGAIESARARVNDLAGVLELGGGPTEVLEFKRIGKKLAPKVEAFIEQGKSASAKLPPQLRQPAFLAVVFLDVINVGLALRALREAKGNEAVFRAAAGAGAAMGFTLAGVAKPFAKTVAGWMHVGEGSVVRMTHLANGVCGYIYAGLNVLAAAEAQEQDDRDRAAALWVAAGAEFIVATVYLRMLLNPAVAAPPYLLAVTVVAAAAYIAATALQDDPLEKFLELCEWGTAPYENPTYHPIWAHRRVAGWKDDYILQSKIMLRVLTRLTISWDRDGWPKVKVSVGFRGHGMRINTSYKAVFEDGRQQTDDRQMFEDERIPTQAPIVVETSPATDYKGFRNISRLWVTVVFRAHDTAEEETLQALLMDDGKGITSGETSFLKP